jgi:hypothetical protein
MEAGIAAEVPAVICHDVAQAPLTRFHTVSLNADGRYF